MPTASEFTAMATAVESFESFLSGASSSAADAAALASIRGGELARLVERTVDQSALDINTARTRLGQLAALCRERATQCERYTSLYAGYESASATYAMMARDLEPGEWLGSPPYPPSRPGPWADRG